MISTSTSAPTPSTSTARAVPLSLPTLLRELKALYPIPRKNQPTRRPNEAALDAFLAAVPHAAEGISESDDSSSRVGEELRGDSANGRSPIAWKMGRIALWALETMDGLVRELEVGLKAGDPPVLPLSASPLILTLLSHALAHALQPLMPLAFPALPPSTISSDPSSNSSSRQPARIVELPPQEIISQAQSALARDVARVLSLAERRPATDIGRLVRDAGGVRGVLKMGVALAWEPPDKSVPGERERNELKDQILRVLDSLPPPQALSLVSPLLAPAPSSASSILAAATTVIPHVRRVAGELMTRALLRPGGVEGVLRGIFGSGEDERSDGREDGDAGKKAEGVARVLGAVPGELKAEDYFPQMIPHLLDLLSSPATPQPYLRALALTLARLLPSQAYLVLPRVHSALHPPSAIHPYTALSALLPLILLAPPSPTHHAVLLTPVLPQLFALHWHLQRTPTADPILRREVEDCLRSWGRVAPPEEVLTGMARVVRAGRGWEGVLGPATPGSSSEEENGAEWHWRGGGEDLAIVWSRPEPPTTITTSTTAEKGDSTWIEAQTLAMLDLQPPPAMLVSYLKAIDRPSVAGDLFVSLLHELRPASTALTDETSSTAAPNDDENSDPRRRVLMMQLILRLVEELGEGLVKGEEARVLSFVAHILEASNHPWPGGENVLAAAKASSSSSSAEPFGLANLRIVDPEEDGNHAGAASGGEDEDGLDSDDEVDLPRLEDGTQVDEEAEAALDGGKLGLVGTAIGLLVAVLQSNEALTPETSPILLVIDASLTRLLESNTPSIRHLVREARLLISVRRATSGPATTLSTSSEPDAVLSQYQQALKLVQDPLVPVRAHGLILLRQLVLPAYQQTRERPSAPSLSPVPPALVPAILDVFLTSVQDPDSYIYLNAVKGLSALVDGWGRDVLGRMVGVYAKGIWNRGWDGGEMGRQEVDLRLRVGEALCGVIERSADALAVHASTLIPPIILTVRASTLPTALRSSALTILSLVASSSPLTLHPYAQDLFHGSLDLLQIESVPRSTHPLPENKKRPTVDSDDDQYASGTPIPEEDDPLHSPLLANARHPVLRRAALHLLSSLLRADPSELGPLGGDALARGQSIVGYVRATDEDGTVRGLAGEVEGDLREAAGGMEGAGIGRVKSKGGLLEIGEGSTGGRGGGGSPFLL